MAKNGSILSEKEHVENSPGYLITLPKTPQPNPIAMNEIANAP